MDENKEVVVETNEEVNTPSYFVGIKFNENSKAYFFSTDEGDLKVGDVVVVDTIRGLELGKVSSLPTPLSEYKSELELKPIIRKATPGDIRQQEENEIKAKESFLVCVDSIKSLELDMNLISCEYTLDRTKVIFTYLASDRVDFRELLKILASKLKCRIELRQIGTRDKAKIVGGIGICGLPLCCSTFLSEFDGISINRAKNQLLSLNIPKLSGHCGKLICCLKYEDDVYTELRKEFPKMGTRVFIEGEQYRITSMNVLTRVIKIEKSDDVRFVTLEELNAMIDKTPKKEGRKEDHEKK